eukprot:scaffold5_cov331-Pavlova_lutheri.AAC.25
MNLSKGPVTDRLEGEANAKTVSKSKFLNASIWVATTTSGDNSTEGLGAEDAHSPLTERVFYLARHAEDNAFSVFRLGFEPVQELPPGNPKAAQRLHGRRPIVQHDPLEVRVDEERNVEDFAYFFVDALVHFRVLQCSEEHEPDREVNSSHPLLEVDFLELLVVQVFGSVGKLFDDLFEVGFAQRVQESLGRGHGVFGAELGGFPAIGSLVPRLRSRSRPTPLLPSARPSVPRGTAATRRRRRHRHRSGTKRVPIVLLLVFRTGLDHVIHTSPGGGRTRTRSRSRFRKPRTIPKWGTHVSPSPPRRARTGG